MQAELYYEYAAEDKLLNFQEFSELYKVKCGTVWCISFVAMDLLWIELAPSLFNFNHLQKELSSDVFEDAYLDDYVKAIFRFDKSHKKMQQSSGNPT